MALSWKEQKHYCFPKRFRKLQQYDSSETLANRYVAKPNVWSTCAVGSEADMQEGQGLATPDF